MNSILVNKAGAFLFTFVLLILSVFTALNGNPGGWTATAVLGAFCLLEGLDLSLTIQKLHCCKTQA